ncbi:YceI family protein [Flavobacterium tibetense]|jgi:polyisoprenoid-binding protein YceI|uniref:YceI family protein n=1 Tax=Flavobacterium tibetense TaxID=2233533 RepID=A0A365P2Q1_9FLAO|nr:YceI family protein [Flavobacterium tibetense]RBA28778.1 YceI family protein [Flavobacterium tibetense]
MKKSLLSFAIIALISFTSCKKESTEDATKTDEASESSASGSYTVDAASSVINWVGSKPAGKHTGTISLADGSFDVTDGNVTGGNFTIAMNSITVTDLEGEDKMNLETHLKGTGDKESEDHFFNVTKYPTGNFKMLSAEPESGAYFVKGILTLKGISKEVNFSAEIIMTDTEIKLTSDPFKINRTTWNVNYASKSLFDNLKDKFIDDDIELVVKVIAKK